MMTRKIVWTQLTYPHLIAMGEKKENTIDIKCFYIMFEGAQILVRVLFYNEYDLLYLCLI